MPKRKKEERVTPIPLAEMNECCRTVAGIKDKERESAVNAALSAQDAEIERLNARIEELESHAFEKGRIASALEGKNVFLQHQIEELRKAVANISKRAGPPPTPPPSAPVRYAATPMIGTYCAVCTRATTERCSRCGAFLCTDQVCVSAHGHGESPR